MWEFSSISVNVDSVMLFILNPLSCREGQKDMICSLHELRTLMFSAKGWVPDLTIFRPLPGIVWVLAVQHYFENNLLIPYDCFLVKMCRLYQVWKLLSLSHALPVAFISQNTGLKTSFLLFSSIQVFKKGQFVDFIGIQNPIFTLFFLLAFTSLCM